MTIIGVGTSYNQKILGAIAQEAGGGHYFRRPRRRRGRPRLRRGAPRRCTRIFDGQAGVLSAASEGLRKDKATPDTDRSLRRNQEVANPYMR